MVLQDQPGHESERVEAQDSVCSEHSPPDGVQIKPSAIGSHPHVGVSRECTYRVGQKRRPSNELARSDGDPKVLDSTEW